MESRASGIREIVQRLPPRLQLRFNSLGGLVQGMVDEASVSRGGTLELGGDAIQFIQLAALVYSLDSFFRTGSFAARSVSALFEGLGMRGVQVGSTTFTSDNINTRQGERLAEELAKSIAGTRLGHIIRRSGTMKGLISTLIDEMSNGETVG